MSEHQRKYERIEVELMARLFIPDSGGKSDLRFEAFTRSKNLSLGGVFVESTFLLKPNVELWVELGLPSESLSIRGRIAHAIQLEHPTFESGMGIEFLDVDSHGREVLLRYFTPAHYSVFYEAFLGEFPHLERDFEQQDVSLVLNLWEEWKIRQAGGPALTASGPPEAPLRRTRSSRSR